MKSYDAYDAVLVLLLKKSSQNEKSNPVTCLTFNIRVCIHVYIYLFIYKHADTHV